MEVTYLANLISTSVGPMREARPSLSTSWYPSKKDVTVLNVDGSSLGNPGRSGFGGLLRRSDGTWIVGFAGSLGFSEILQAELMAILKGLSLAWDLGIRRLVCCSDSKMAIDIIEKACNLFHVYAVLIQNIKDLLMKDWLVTLIHTWREGNAAADFLAKLGAQGDSSWSIFEAPVSGLESTLASDASGTVYLRH